MKILISGVSGSGKTTLAREISKKYKIPFLTSSTKMFWKEYGIKCHLDIVKRSVEDVNFGLEFQYKCLEYRTREFAKHSQFVSDRGILDSIVYFLMQNAPYTSSSVTHDYISVANDFLKNNPNCITLLLGMPPKIGNDGKRIQNHYYQRTSDAIFNLAKNTLIERDQTIHNIHNWDWRKRNREINNIISRYGI